MDSHVAVKFEVYYSRVSSGHEPYASFELMVQLLIDLHHFVHKYWICSRCWNFWGSEKLHVYIICMHLSYYMILQNLHK